MNNLKVSKSFFNDENLASGRKSFKDLKNQRYIWDDNIAPLNGGCIIRGPMVRLFSGVHFVAILTKPSPG